MKLRTDYLEAIEESLQKVLPVKRYTKAEILALEAQLARQGALTSKVQPRPEYDVIEGTVYDLRTDREQAIDSYLDWMYTVRGPFRYKGSEVPEVKAAFRAGLLKTIKGDM